MTTPSRRGSVGHHQLGAATDSPPHGQGTKKPQQPEPQTWESSIEIPISATLTSKKRTEKTTPPKTSRPTKVAGAVAPACKEKQNPRGKEKHAQPEEQKDRQGHFAPTLATPIRSHPQPGAPSMSKSQPLLTESCPRQPTRNSQKKGGASTRNLKKQGPRPRPQANPKKEEKRKTGSPMCTMSRSRGVGLYSHPAHETTRVTAPGCTTHNNPHPSQ